MATGAGLLLEAFYALSQRDSISELKYEETKKETISLILSIDPSGFTLEQWEYALSYIADRPISFSGWDDLTGYLQKIKRTSDW